MQVHFGCDPKMMFLKFATFVVREMGVQRWVSQPSADL